MRRAATCSSVLVALVAGACGGTRPPPEPVVGPTGYVYPLGTPPRETRFSQTATLYFLDGSFQRALELALEGIESEPENPIHYLLAGMAHLRLDDFRGADEMFAEAQGIYPAYELDIEPQREAAWGEAFNAGLAAYAEGDVEQTIERWRNAIVIYDVRPEAHRNLADRPATRVLSEEDVASREESAEELEEQLASLLMLTDRYAEAEPLLRRRLERDPESVQTRSDLASALNSMGRPGEAREIYSELLSEGGLQVTELFNLGIGLFRVDDFAGAAEAFRRLTELQPESRDAWFNRANALFAMEAWTPLVEVSGRLLELDPLGENALLITARAHLETGDRDVAIQMLQRVDATPVYLDGMRLRQTGAGTAVEGRVTGNVALEGTPVDLLFTFFGDQGSEVGTAVATVEAPPEGEISTFVVVFPGRALSYRYELVGPTVPQS
jgi:tetratricopeptide (TPR) repeat protein